MIHLKDLFRNPFPFEEDTVSLSDTIVYLLLFLLNPTVALVISFLFFILKEGKACKQAYSFYFILAAWLGVLNMTKQLFSDQIYYASIFLDVDISNPLLAVIDYRPGDSLREPIFNLFSVICRYLVGPNPRAYFFICTFVIYSLQYLALDMVLRKSNRSKMEILSAVLLLSFFTPLFVQSVHALRQNLGFALIVYAIAYRSVYGRHQWLFLIMAFFTHNMTAFFIVLALLPWLYEILTKRKIFILLIAYIVFLIVYSRLGVLMEMADMASMKTIGSVLSSKGNEVGYFSQYALLVYALPTIIVASIVLKKIHNTGIYLPIYTLCLLYIMTLLLIESFGSNQTLQARYSLCLYVFMPFVLLFPMEKNNTEQSIWCFVVMIFFVLRFFFRDMDWGEYASWTEILFNSFLHFWSTSYYMV